MNLALWLQQNLFTTHNLTEKFGNLGFWKHIDVNRGKSHIAKISKKFNQNFRILIWVDSIVVWKMFATTNCKPPLIFCCSDSYSNIANRICNKRISLACCWLAKTHSYSVIEIIMMANAKSTCIFLRKVHFSLVNWFTRGTASISSLVDSFHKNEWDENHHLHTKSDLFFVFIGAWNIDYIHNPAKISLKSLFECPITWNQSNHFQSKEMISLELSYVELGIRF